MVPVVGWGDSTCCTPFSRLFRPKVPPVFVACQEKDWTAALRLLDSRALVSKWETQYRDPLKRSALHLAVEADEMSIDVVRVMLEKGYSPNMQDIFGDTPLHYAVKRRRLSRSLLKLLLEATGVDINAANGKGRTCLHIAASTPKFPRELVNLIIVKGGDVSKRSNSGRTPLNSAVRRSRKLVPIFLAHGSDPFVRTLNGKHAVDWAKENNRLLLQLRLEETRNVVVLCIPFVLNDRFSKRINQENLQPDSFAIDQHSYRKVAADDCARGGEEEEISKPYEPVLITMLPIDLIRLVKDMLF